MKRAITILLPCMCTLLLFSDMKAQTGDVLEPNEQPLSTLLSFKFSGGYGFGRARENYGVNGTSRVWWSTGQGWKMDAAIDVPLLPIDVINPNGDESEPERFSIVGLELEVASGYHISDGGTTNSGIVTTTRSYTYIPVTLGFNARASFGAGLPSVYVGAGGGVYLKGIYEENITTEHSAVVTKNTYDPPVPFALYGVMGLEFPLLYSPDDGNSAMDIFVQARLSEATNYIYKFTSTTSSPTFSNTTVVTVDNGGFGITASNVAFSLGIKFNIY
ncbi:MAG: hypothetical protein ABI778_03220 [Ignavibacteriota bacterium]